MTKLLLNDKLKGVELYFEEKPEQTILDGLKSNGFRWHNGKKCWYAKQSEKTMAEAQKYTLEQGTEQPQLKPLTLVAPVAKVTKEVKNNIILPLWDRVQFVEGSIVSNRFKYVGSNYTGLSTKETAAEVRKLLKCQFPEVKFSITSDHSHISITIKQSPYNYSTLEYSSELQPYEYRNHETENNKELTAIKSYCKSLLNSYNYDDSDSQSDYFNTHFYDSVSIDSDYVQTEQTEEQKAIVSEFRNKIKSKEIKEEERKEIQYQEHLAQRELDKISYQESAKKEAEQIQIINASISITDLVGERQYFIIGSQFANLNKNDTLDQYIEEVAKGEFNLQNIKITKEIHFQTEESLSYFSNMLLNDFDFLSETGGSYTDDVRINSMTDYHNMTKEEQETVIFNLYGVGIYYNNQLQFVVDAQGHNYARYVGLVENVTTQKDVSVKQLVNHEQIQELKGKVETLEDYSVSVITDNNLLNVWSNEKFNEYKELMKTELSRNNFKLNKSIIQQLPEESETLKVCMYRLLKEVDGIQEQFKTADLKQGQKVTLFYISDFGSIVNQMVTLDSVEYTKYAQYDNTVKLTWTPKGKRKQYYNFFYSTLLIYDGWLELPKSVLHEISESNDFVITKTKYLSCDKKQYDEILEHYEAQGLKPVINTYKPTF